MAEFHEVMREWVRARKAKSSNADKDILSFHSLNDYDDALITAIEKNVMEWAAEHPEPVYPTFAEWLNSIGVTISDRPFPAPNIPVYVFQVNAKMFEPIPADIAKKLGIEPKKG